MASGSFFKKEPKTLNTIFFHLLTYVFGKNSMAFRKGMIAVWGDYRVDLWGKLTETVFIGRFRKAFERVGEHEL